MAYHISISLCYNAHFTWKILGVWFVKSVLCVFLEFAGEGKKTAVPCYAAKICILTVIFFSVIIQNFNLFYVQTSM